MSISIGIPRYRTSIILHITYQSANSKFVIHSTELLTNRFWYSFFHEKYWLTKVQNAIRIKIGWKIRPGCVEIPVLNTWETYITNLVKPSLPHLLTYTGAQPLENVSPARLSFSYKTHKKRSEALIKNLHLFMYLSYFNWIHVSGKTFFRTKELFLTI